MSLHELDPAQKVSDLVACVDGETIAKIGRPEEIFCGDTIACLYGVSAQAYDVVSGSMFLQKAKGEPKGLCDRGAAAVGLQPTIPCSETRSPLRQASYPRGCRV